MSAKCRFQILMYDEIMIMQRGPANKKKTEEILWYCILKRLTARAVFHLLTPFMSQLMTNFRCLLKKRKVWPLPDAYCVRSWVPYRKYQRLARQRAHVVLLAKTRSISIQPYSKAFCRACRTRGDARSFRCYQYYIAYRRWIWRILTSDRLLGSRAVMPDIMHHS